MCSQDAGVPWLGTGPLVRNGLTSLRQEISKNFILRFAKPDPTKQLTKVTWPPKKSMMPECLSAQPRLEAALAQLFLKHLTCGISTSSSHQHVDRHLARHRHHRTCGWPGGPINRSCLAAQTQWLTLPRFGSFTGIQQCQIHLRSTQQNASKRCKWRGHRRALAWAAGSLCHGLSCAGIPWRPTLCNLSTWFLHMALWRCHSNVAIHAILYTLEGRKILHSQAPPLAEALVSQSLEPSDHTGDRPLGSHTPCKTPDSLGAQSTAHLQTLQQW